MILGKRCQIFILGMEIIGGGMKEIFNQKTKSL